MWAWEWDEVQLSSTALNENEKMKCVGRSKYGIDTPPPQVKNLKAWLDSVSTGESPKNVGGCKRAAVRPRKVLFPKKTRND